MRSTGGRQPQGGEDRASQQPPPESDCRGRARPSRLGPVVVPKRHEPISPGARTGRFVAATRARLPGRGDDDTGTGTPGGWSHRTGAHRATQLPHWAPRGPVRLRTAMRTDTRVRGAVPRTAQRRGRDGHVVARRMVARADAPAEGDGRCARTAVRASRVLRCSASECVSLGLDGLLFGVELVSEPPACVVVVAVGLVDLAPLGVDRLSLCVERGAVGRR